MYKEKCWQIAWLQLIPLFMYKTNRLIMMTCGHSFPRLVGGSSSLWNFFFFFISVASVSHCVVNPLHWSFASLLIWGTISPADGSLLKHRKRSELIRIAPVIPLISPLTQSLLPNIAPFPSLSRCFQAEVFRAVEVWICRPLILQLLFTSEN